MVTFFRLVLLCTLILQSRVSPLAAENVDGTIAATDSLAMSWQPYWRLFQASADEAGLSFKYQVDGERGTERNILADLKRGRVNVAALSLDSLGELIPELAVLSAPFLFENEQVADFAFDRQLLPVINTLLDEHGFVALQWAEIGWVHIAADRSFTSPRYVQSLNLRIADNAAEREFAASLRASSLALMLDEIRPAIAFDAEQDRKRLDGGFVTVNGHYFVTSDHWTALTLTSHTYKAGLFVADRDWLAAFTPDRRDDVILAFEKMGAARAQGRKQVQESLNYMADTGVEISPLSVAERQDWIAVGLAAHGPILTRIGGRAQFLYDAVNTAKESYLSSPEVTGAINAPPAAVREE